MKNNIYTGLFCMGIAFSGVLSSCDVMDTKPFERYGEAMKRLRLMLYRHIITP